MTRLSNFLDKCKIKNEQTKKVKTFYAEGSSTAELYSNFFLENIQNIKKRTIMIKQKDCLKMEPTVSMRSQLMGVHEYSANLGDENVFC